MRIVRRTVLLSLLVTALFAGNADAATRTFPGCRPTLAKCIGSVAPGSTIVLKTNKLIPIPAELTVKKGINLVAAKGFKPRIGRTGASSSLMFELTGSSDVAITGVRFEHVALYINANSGSGHTLRFERNRLTSTGSNGQQGLQLYIAPGAKGTIAVRDNVVSSTGEALSIGGRGGAVTVTGNVVTAPVAADSQIGIYTRIGGSGARTLTIANNVVHHVVGCNCGIVTAIFVSADDSVKANVRILNNTVGDLAVLPGNGGHGIGVFSPDDTAHIDLRLFNNVVYNTHSTGYRVDPDGITAKIDANAEFGNPFNSFGGHDAGTVYSVDPLFAGPGSGNYRLTASSPLLNKGETCIPSLTLPRADAARKFRLNGASVDIGAYERGSTASGAVKGVSRNGTNGANTMMGTKGRDVFCGFGGNDVISGFGAGDFLVGGAGKDMVFGGAGSDRIDLRDGKSGNDWAYGEAGADLCLADTGDHKASC